MPLTKRQKRRLLETSKLILSLDSVVTNFRSIQMEHAEEIKLIIAAAKAYENDQSKSSDTLETDSTEMVNYNSTYKQKNHDNVNGHRNEHQKSESTMEELEVSKENDTAPPWAKKLWKSIAKKCHPDRLSLQNLTALEIAKRSHWFLESRDLYSQRKFDQLIHIGIQVDVYVDELSMNKQISILEQQHNKISQEIDDIQSSYAWKWGNSWENINAKLGLLINFLRSEMKQIPDNKTLLEIIKKIEEQ